MARSSVRRFGFLLVAVMLMPFGLTMATAPAGAAAAPPIWPVPQQVTARDDAVRLPRSVGLVRGATTDAAAERVVRAELGRAGVREFKVTGGQDPGTQVTIWLGGGGDALRGLGVQGADGLPAEGYVLAAGRDGRRGHIVLAGADRDGTFYAAHSLRQAIRRGTVPGLVVRDRPSMKYRGLIEGFYGTPWSHESRLDLMDYLGAHKMNTFEYAPKDDPYHRERWRDPYPADKLAELGELAGRAGDNHVDFTFALSPGLSICYSSAEDMRALLAKFESIYKLGGRSFNVPFDDIDYNTWHCDADPQRFGTGPAAAGKAQSHVLNQVQAWVRSKGDVTPLQMVPTEYYNTTESAYKKALRDNLDGDVIVQWTGTAVVPPTITKAQAAQARAVFGHEVLVWDNYPVNDYIAGRLPVAAYTGRENGIAEHLTGLISNPANQAAVSKIALFSSADMTWNNAAYDPGRSWRAALAERAGGDRETTTALLAFADVSTYDSTLHRTQAPALRAAIDRFWQAWRAGDADGAVAGLRDDARGLARAPGLIREGVADPRFAAEAKAWLDATGLWGRAMGATLDMLAAQAAGDGDRAWAARRVAERHAAEAGKIRDTTEPHKNSPVKIGDGVIDKFIDDAVRANDEWLGIPGPAQATSSMGTHSDNVPARMVDGDPETFYWSNRAPNPGDSVGVDLRAAREIGDVSVLMSKSSSPNDYIHAGTLEYSADGTTWTPLAGGTGPDVKATAPAGTRARYVRYRATGPNDGFWVVVREFTVKTRDGATLTVTGKPDPAPGSSLAAAADGNAGSAYAAAAAPRPGDALTVAAPAPRPLRKVIVLQPDGPAARATVQVRTGDGWRTIGRLHGSYGEFRTNLTGDAVRLLWADGSAAPRIAEVILR